MPDIWMDVDTALAEVPVNIFPLTDDTDFKSIEGAVAYNAAGMTLRWHFVTTGGAYSVTSVTPTSGGNYDWTDQGDSGIYTIEIPASGGASINNDTEGFGWFTGVATGILPWRGPVIGFRAAGLNDLLIDNAYSTTRGLAGTALPAAAADAAGGLVISDAGGLDIDAKLANTNEVTAARMGALTDWIDGGRLDLILDAILADTNELQGDWVNAGRLDVLIDAIKAKTDSLTFTVAGDVDCNVQTWKGSAAADMTGDAYARLGAPAGASVSADVAAVKAETAAIVTDTNELQTDLTNGGRLDLLIDAILEDTGTTLDGIVDSILEDTGTTLPATLATIDGKADTIAGYIDTEVGAIYDRIGAPAGASVSADIAAIKAETAAIVEDTGTTLDGKIDDILTDTAEIGAAGAGLTAVPWNAAWDAEVQSEVFDALDAAFTDATGLTANGLLDRIRTLGWILRNKIEVTDANGNTVIYKDDSTTPAFSVNAMLTDDSTTTTRLRAA